MAEQLATLIDAQVKPLKWHQFPDGESLVTLDPEIGGAEVAILTSLNDPDHKTLPLLFSAATARELGATRVGLIAPYLGYMRQDTAFHPGEAVSARHYARILDETFNWLVTVDPHLHRNPDLNRLFRIPTLRVETATLIADWMRKNVRNPVILGPDSESRQWVARVAQYADVPNQILRKTRRGDREVDVSLPDAAALKGATSVIVDDIASSGRTLIETLSGLGASGIDGAVCVVIHPLFPGGAYQDVLAAGAADVVSTDTIPHASNRIAVAPLLAEAVAQLVCDKERPRSCGGAEIC